MAAKSDKLFQKRKALTRADLERKKATKKPNKRVLIVSEGEVTEPNYFEAFKAFAGLVNVDVDVCGKECDSAPISVVDFAEKKANSEGHFSSGGYDVVYCVFDRDTHESFERAFSKVYSLNKSDKFLARHIESVVSYPCFEIWLLFHFVYTRTPFTESGKKSPADMVAAALRKVSPMFSDYDKALSAEQCAHLFGLIDTAQKHSELAQTDAQSTGELNPSTMVHDMLEKLRSANVIKKK